MRIPNHTTCEALLKQNGMPEHILAHSRQVHRVAKVLLEHWIASRNAIDCGLVLAAALLHDITKTRSLTTQENHAQTGALYLRELG